MNLAPEIEQVKALRAKLAAVVAPSPFTRDALTRTTILIGKLELVQGEDAARAAAQQQLDASIAKANQT
ncbi:MAG: hypothetical protein NTZ16_12690 [Verrucomicrobia bacterium]|nr:hypothetical protein [Verrucomicrobiota bacterium]